MALSTSLAACMAVLQPAADVFLLAGEGAASPRGLRGAGPGAAAPGAASAGRFEQPAAPALQKPAPEQAEGTDVRQPELGPPALGVLGEPLVSAPRQHGRDAS